MNNTRRKEITKLIEKIQELHGEVEAIRDEEQEYIDCMPENLQESERAEMAQTAVDELGEAMEKIEESITNLETASE